MNNFTLVSYFSFDNLHTNIHLNTVYYIVNIHYVISLLYTIID